MDESEKTRFGVLVGVLVVAVGAFVWEDVVIFRGSALQVMLVVLVVLTFGALAGVVQVWWQEREGRNDTGMVVEANGGNSAGVVVEAKEEGRTEVVAGANEEKSRTGVVVEANEGNGVGVVAEANEGNNTGAKFNEESSVSES